MAKNFHRFSGIGRLGAMPEMRYTPSGLEITNFSVAFSDDYFSKDKDGWEERTLWIRFFAMGPLAERIASKLDKGDKIYIEATLRNSRYEKDGVTVHSIDFKADRYELLEKADKEEDEIEGTSAPVETSTVEDEIDGDMPPWDE